MEFSLTAWSGDLELLMLKEKLFQMMLCLCRGQFVIQQFEDTFYESGSYR